MIVEQLTVVQDSDPHSAALNMAIDEALLQRANGPLLRLYRWESPAVSFGYFGRFAEVSESWPGRELVRRWTGGGIVPHGEDFTYTLIIPRECGFFRTAPIESYRKIHEAVADALALGGAWVLANESAPKISGACFENPAQHDVMFDGGKVAGAAQRRTQAGLLHQGSIQLATVPAGFGVRLARSLAADWTERELSEEALAAARPLAESKYGAQAWLTRF